MKNALFVNQVRWVLLLLATAVILPTVCLLWFMNQTIKNEHLAVRQKLIDLYTDRTEHLFGEGQDLYVPFFLIEPVASRPEEPTFKNRPHYLFAMFADRPGAKHQGMLIYDSQGRLIYPVLGDDLQMDTERTAEVFPLEQTGDYQQALIAYQQIAKETSDPLIRGRSQLSIVRCLTKLDRMNEAIKQVSALCWPDDPETLDAAEALITLHARAYLADLYQQADDEDGLFACLYRSLDPWLLPMAPAPTIIWQLDRSIDTAYRTGLANQLQTEIVRAQSQIAAYENALHAAELYSTLPDDTQWPDETIRRLRPDENLYGIKFQAADETILGLAPAETMLKVLRATVEDLQDDTVMVQVQDNFGQVIAGQKTSRADAFLKLRPKRHFPDFQVTVYFRNSEVFKNAAGRQTMVYLWTGALGIGLVLLTGSAAIRTVSKQARLNRLKNNFIATVTHELKTPLSSTRLLVDTLLENDCRDEQQTHEYLELIAKENRRLSRLIDNFLTFSRMERNKNAFDFARVNPAEIARTAAGAVQTKFAEADCRFGLSIQDNLPQIWADKDAMATVLVNLLDNAWKYSGDNKQIELNVFTEDHRLCFAVQDNGIGLSRREKKKIFDRFYQANSSLSRQAEGTGLGLSIVKFIVDAHHGRITVESKSDSGSTFTVRLPFV